MKVKELKNLLSGADDNDEVILAKDSEGNRHSPLANIFPVIYVPVSKYSGEIFSREDDGGVFGINAIVFSPMN